MVGDVELRLINPAKNQFRLYALTECRTVFGELALRIVWGRIGHKRMRERTETFASSEALEQRRSELLRLRARHGYVVVEPPPASSEVALERDIVEQHGLSLTSPVVRDLVARWHSVTTELARVVGRGRNASTVELDLVDVSTLAAMYAHAEGFG